MAAALSFAEALASTQVAASGLGFRAFGFMVRV